MNALHAIHDFLPRHRAGSEIYTHDLCRALQTRHHITVLTADRNPSNRHGQVTWRVHEGLPVVEITNNWVCRTFEETYRPPLITDRIRQVLRAVQPDVVHVHNLLNLSFDLPALARAAGIPIVATLHDYTLVCASGGQRIHRADQHVCHEIDVGRCARCFGESSFHDLMTLGRAGVFARVPGLVQRLAGAIRHRMPGLARSATRLVKRAARVPIRPADIEARLACARKVFEQVDVFVAPSAALADEYRRLGLDGRRLRVADYGFRPLERLGRRAHDGPLRLGYVGTLVWHKGVHVLLDAVRQLPAGGWDLKIFGDPTVCSDYVSRLRAQASGLPVRFMGGFDRAGVADVYAGIDVLVVPSLWLENSPLVIHEAFMAGVAVVGARIGGIADLVTEGENGMLYAPSSVDGLATVLRALVTDPSRVDALAARVTPVRSITEDAAGWEAIYEDVVEGNASRKETLV